MRKSCDDLNQMKFTEKCLQIEWNCDRNTRKYRDIARGFQSLLGVLQSSQAQIEPICSNLGFVGG